MNSETAKPVSFRCGCAYHSLQCFSFILSEQLFCFIDWQLHYCVVINQFTFLFLLRFTVHFVAGRIDKMLRAQAVVLRCRCKLSRAFYAKKQKFTKECARRDFSIQAVYVMKN